MEGQSGLSGLSGCPLLRGVHLSEVPLYTTQSEPTTCCKRIQQSPQLSWSASTVQHEPQHWYTQRAQWQQLPKVDTPQGKHLDNYIQCTMQEFIGYIADVTHCTVTELLNMASSVAETWTCMRWFKVVLLSPENTKTDDIHQPSHSRECSQWKH